MGSRGSFLGAAVVALCAAGCGAGPRTPARSPTFEAALAERPRLLWVAAHGDDESLTGGVLARACVGAGVPCHFFVMNRDAGASCDLPGGCHPDMKTVRYGEMRKAARLYRATLEEYDFFNAPLPVESFPSRHGIERIWMREGDPVGLVARAIRRFRPDLVVTLGPYRGFTGHPEHQATARITLAAIRLAANPQARHPYLAGLPPHRPRYYYFVLNKYWFMKAAGDPGDPAPYQETFDGTKPCAGRGRGSRSCLSLRDDFSRAHASQGDMAAVRAASKFWGTAYLRRIDPFGAEATELVAELDAAHADTTR